MRKIRAFEAYLEEQKKEVRLAYFSLGVLIIFLLFYLLFLDPILEGQAKVRTKIDLSSKQIETMKATIVEVTVSGAAKQAKYAKLKAELEDLEDYIEVYRNEFVPANKMTSLVRDVLQKENALILKNIETFPQKSAENDDTIKQLVSYIKTPIYEQGIRLTFSGEYFSTLSYLKDMENLQWRLFWDEIDYKVTEYPKANITLRVHTITLGADGEAVKNEK